MPDLVIPTLTDSETLHYRQRTRLDDQDWFLTFLWNERCAVWTLTIDALDGSRVLTGQRIVVGLPLLGRAIGGPSGNLVALSETSDLSPPGLTELGARVRLWFLNDG